MFGSTAPMSSCGVICLALIHTHNVLLAALPACARPAGWPEPQPAMQLRGTASPELCSRAPALRNTLLARNACGSTPCLSLSHSLTPTPILLPAGGRRASLRPQHRRAAAFLEPQAAGRRPAGGRCGSSQRGGEARQAPARHQPVGWGRGVVRWVDPLTAIMRIDVYNPAARTFAVAGCWGCAASVLSTTPCHVGSSLSTAPQVLQLRQLRTQPARLLEGDGQAGGGGEQAVSTALKHACPFACLLCAEGDGPAGGGRERKRCGGAVVLQAASSSQVLLELRARGTLLVGVPPVLPLLLTGHSSAASPYARVSGMSVHICTELRPPSALSRVVCREQAERREASGAAYRSAARRYYLQVRGNRLGEHMKVYGVFCNRCAAAGQQWNRVQRPVPPTSDAPHHVPAPCLDRSCCHGIRHPCRGQRAAGSATPLSRRLESLKGCSPAS